MVHLTAKLGALLSIAMLCSIAYAQHAAASAITDKRRSGSESICGDDSAGRVTTRTAAATDAITIVVTSQSCLRRRSTVSSEGVRKSRRPATRASRRSRSPSGTLSRSNRTSRSLLSLPEVRIGGRPRLLNRANGGPPRVGGSPWGSRGVPGRCRSGSDVRFRWKRFPSGGLPVRSSNEARALSSTLGPTSP